MRTLTFALLLSLGTALPALAQHSTQQTQEDIKRHRAMAAAHESAAQCLQAGKGEEVCMAQLQQACKGLALGKFCGMRHGH